jgi:hypothetical protein
MEHRYGGSLLAALVLHQPLAGLGGALVPLRVGFQQDAPVDDFVVRAEGLGALVTWYVAARRRPVLAPSKAKTVALFKTFLRVLQDRLSEVEVGTVLLGLAVKGPYGPAYELEQLAKVALAHGSPATFRTSVAGRSNALRGRLQRIDDVVSAAAAELNWNVNAMQERDWTWTLLRALRVVHTFLEEGQQDAVQLTSRLADVVDGDAESADHCRQELAALSADLAKAGGDVTEADVRRQLVGRVRLAFPPDMAPPKAALEARERELNLRTPRVLRLMTGSGTVELAVDRTTAAEELATALRVVGETAGTLVVGGEPSVGKSVLVLDVVDQLRLDGAQVAVFSLRTSLDLGVPLPRLFGAFPVARQRLLVLDGAEVVQEGRGDLRAIAAAALDAGLGVVAVTRDDAKRAVVEALTDVAGVPPMETFVAPLPAPHVETLITTFPVLARLRERRSQWLLQRLGLVDLLLRGGAEAGLPDGTLSEADVFASVWQGWVRRHEEHSPGGSSPDARERALLDVARRQLGMSVAVSSAHPDALPSLRSDGLLEAYSALRPQEEFANDVVRDFATVHLLLREGDRIITEAGAPRWILRAARVAAQARLLEGGAIELRRQLSVFDELAATHGARWADVPWEAALRCGDAHQLLDAVTSSLLADDGSRLQELLRVVEQHFSEIAAADPVLVEPLMAWLAKRELDVPYRLAPRVKEAVVLWLRGVSRDEAAEDDKTTRDVRRRLRDAVLARDLNAGDDVLLEAHALLGRDMNAAAERTLRNVAVERPWGLRRVVESTDAVRSLVRGNAALLADLATAYFIDDSDDNASSGPSILRDGVRGHGFAGLGTPRAAWYYGPFWTLLGAEARLGMELISNLLFHAATKRVGHERNRTPALAADLLGLGQRTYIGDGDVYVWYRGRLGSPAPCVSALLACERAMDQRAASGIPLRSVALSFLTHAYDLATVGLVVGFLVRHLDRVSDELDDFLAQPELWELEVRRVAGELGGLHRDDEEGIRGRQLRRVTFREVALAISAAAIRSGDEADRVRLGRIAQRLLAAGGTGASQASLEVRRAASYFDLDCYKGGAGASQGRLSYQEPAEITAALAAQREDVARTGNVYRLQKRYRLTLEPPFHTGLPDIDYDAIGPDLATARALAASPPSVTQDLVDGTVTATAGAAVRHVAAGGSIDDEDLAWAIDRLVAALKPNPPGLSEYEGSLYALGADRSAAAAVPSLLMPAYTEGDDPLLNSDGLDVVTQGLSWATTHLTNEVRRITALALRALWAAPCGPAEARCRHRRAWAAIDLGARDVALGRWDAGGRRPFTTLDGDLIDALHGASSQDLFLPRLGAALASVCHADSARCLVAEAAGLREALLDAYAPTAVHYAERGFDVRDEDHALVAEALLAATEQDKTLMPQLVAAMKGPSEATAALLDAVCTVATYDEARREQLRAVWPAIMQTAVDLVEPTADYPGRAIAALIPAPLPVSSDRRLADTLSQAREGWIPVGELAPLIERWLPVAEGCREAVARLAMLLLSSPRDQQIALGLPWIRRLVSPETGTPVIEYFVLMDWLRELHSHGALEGQARADYDIIVDTLAAAGLEWARELQRRDA